MVDLDDTQPIFQHDKGCRIASKYESLDYEICENELYQSDHKFREAHSAARKDFARWILFIVIGKFLKLSFYSFQKNKVNFCLIFFRYFDCSGGMFCGHSH